MNNPPLKIHENIILEDNKYFCNDLRDAANYVNSFHVHFTLTTNLNKKLKNELVSDIFSPAFQYAKEMTVNEVVEAEEIEVLEAELPAGGGDVVGLCCWGVWWFC